MLGKAILLVINIFSAFGAYVIFIYKVFIAAFKKTPPWHVLREQFYSIGVLSFNVVAITGLSTGIILAAQSFYQLSEKGLAGVTGLMVAKAMITELGPVLTALMVTGRVGSAMCAELGTMKVTEQIDAMRSMAVNPLRYLVAPRFISGIFMIPLLTIFSILLGIFGGYAIATLYFGMPGSNYFDPMPANISAFDIFTGVFKSFCFGIFLVTICCYKGMDTKGGAAGVGKATTSSVVISYVTILISDFLLTLALNNIYQEFISDKYI
ncbi:MAG TPA: ABC transporter permease [Chlamydiales bacterium]|mgnify:CR=1 FL=1|nr:ABC transporter permease [Chlamydiales bacterium]